jgi:hypothetical protein
MAQRGEKWVIFLQEERAPRSAPRTRVGGVVKPRLKDNMQFQMTLRQSVRKMGWTTILAYYPVLVGSVH